MQSSIVAFKRKFIEISIPKITPYPIKIRWYSLSYILSFLIITWRIKYLIKKYEVNISDDEFDILSFNTMFFGILGGRIGHLLIDYFSYGYKFDLYDIIAVWNGGMAFQPGLFCGLVVGLVCMVLTNKRKLIPNLLDIILPNIPISIFIGRLGNFMNEEFMNKIPYIGIPSCLFASLTEGLLLYIYLLVFINFRPYVKYESSLAFFLGYGIARFVNDIFRQEQEFYNLKFSQYVCLFLIISSITLLNMIRHKNKTNNLAN